MAKVEGILVRLKTKDEKDAGTSDFIYVGVVGTGGGSEFPLDVLNFNDFEKGSDVTYVFGNIWEQPASGDIKIPYESDYTGSGWNHPKEREIDLYQVQYVYLRKHSHSGDRNDDKWQMDDVEVILYGPGPYHSGSNHKRTFRKTEDIWLGNEFGLQVWIPEIR